ncbi:UxaA family hydrolase [Aquibacillus albus]|uniref:Altronate dehydratase small subunit n=1 Tax=Aquibacillus albus TaxID=1168171 RepID=A0ABS2MX00_9BACI|nr:UxaA family hydrolase [Aquibacillus albus]MBM7570318.1 altronate dehydratase small subunit [Aquibacillus albus]
MQEKEYKYVLLGELDSVAVALDNIPSGADVNIAYKSIKKTIKMIDSIEFGDKFAVRYMNQGDPIIKYGEIIGTATRPIKQGEHVHGQNFEGTRGRVS